VETGGQDILAAAGEQRAVAENLRQISAEAQSAALEQFATAQESLNQTLEGQRTQLEGIRSALDTQTEAINKANEEPVPVEVEGLEELESSVAGSSVETNANTGVVKGLSEKLTTTNANLAEGIDLKVDAVQELNVNVQGLQGAVEKLKPQFEAVATKAARAVVSEALRQLAAAAGDAESAKTFSNVNL
jgi:uncharacterized protein YoxC